MQLLEAVHDVDGLERLRFHFAASDRISRGSASRALTRRCRSFAEHVHLPLQSGSDRILKAMHRTYTAEKYLRLVDQLRAARDGYCLTTDVIVGFPGETETITKKHALWWSRCRFDNAFVFRYSPRT